MEQVKEGRDMGSACPKCTFCLLPKQIATKIEGAEDVSGVLEGVEAH